MLIDYNSMTDSELQVEIDKAMLAPPDPADADRLQIEICTRRRQKFTRPDGTVGYEPPGWPGPF